MGGRRPKAEEGPSHPHPLLTPAGMRLKCGSVGGPLKRGSLESRRRHVHDAPIAAMVEVHTAH